MEAEAEVARFLDGVEDPVRRRDAETLVALMSEVTGEPPVMWGASIIGFGRARYRHATGREGDTALASFSPRQRELVLYLSDDGAELPGLDGLGPHRAGKGCIYLKRLADVDQAALRSLVEHAVQRRRDADPTSR